MNFVVCALGFSNYAISIIYQIVYYLLHCGNHITTFSCSDCCADSVAEFVNQ